MTFADTLARDGITITIVEPAAGEDRDGNRIDNWDAATRTPVQGIAQQQLGSSENIGDGRAGHVTEWLVFLEPCAAPTPRSRLEWDDNAYQIAADRPPKLVTRHRVPHHWEMRMRQVQG